MITIATYRNLMTAELAKARLESCGIKAMIADVFSYTLGYGAVMDGVRLQVADEEADRARAVLASEECVDLPDDSTIMAEETEPEADRTELYQEPGSGAESNRPGGWSALFLFLAGIVCLILGRPAGYWGSMNPFSGQLILLGETLVVAGLWIAYGRLNTEGDHEMPPE